MQFKEYFESKNIKKIWHNYSFDRHILYNHSINCQGFAGDTMHMARLWDTGIRFLNYCYFLMDYLFLFLARLTEGGYSLESISSDLLETYFK